MSEETLYVDGELYLSLEIVAEVYEVQVAWLREAYDFGLLGLGVDAGATVCVAALQMDRVATIVRMHQVFELDVEMIAMTLDDAGAEPVD